MKKRKHKNENRGVVHGKEWGDQRGLQRETKK